MFECNNVLNNEESKASNCNRLEKLMVTYLHMYKWNYVLSDPAIKKNVKTLRNLLNLLHILSCALPMLFMRNLLNLSTLCLHHRCRRLLLLFLYVSASFSGWFSSCWLHLISVWFLSLLCPSSSSPWLRVS